MEQQKRLISKYLVSLFAIFCLMCLTWIIPGYGTAEAAPPTITSFSPSFAGTEQFVFITGTNFTDPTAVKFGGTDAYSFFVVDPTQIQAMTNMGSTGKITVTTPEGTATSVDDFIFCTFPTITSFTPTSGGTGTVVTITGSHFLPCASHVMFGNYGGLHVIVDSDTQIRATVGGGATGKVQVSGAGGFVNSSGDFTFTPVGPGTYYVDTENGNDSNDGSLAHPWKTLHHAISQINGGSSGTYTLHVALGTYSRPTEADTGLTLSQNNVTIVGASGSGPIIDGTEASAWTTGLEITGANVTINNLYITNFSYGIKTDGCSPEISRNTIYDNEFNIGINAGSPFIKNNLIYETISGAVSFGITIGGSGTVSPKIYHNTIDGGLYDGIYIDGSGNTPDIKYNIITGFGQYGIENYNGVGNPVIDYNDVWSNTSGNYNGCTAGANDISQDPKYGSYTLLGTSPCINAIPTGDPPNDPVTEDMDGTARPYGSGYDMGCYENTTLPAVTTTAASSITSTTASSGGDVTSGGSSSVTGKGVCWSTSANPTVSLPTKTTDGPGTGSFASSITGLIANTTYHVRAYATNTSGTSYGDDKPFTTSSAPLSAGTYYVDVQNGNDSNNGSSANPWKTLHHAIDQINGGHAGTYILHVALGTYSINVTYGESDSQMVLSQSSVTIIGESGSTPIIDGTNAQNWPKGIEITGSNVSIKNLSVTGFSDTYPEPEGEGIRISAGTGNNIRNCRVYGNSFGVRISYASGSTIQECEIFNNSTHGIDIIGSTGTVVVRNKIHDNPKYGIRVESSSEISRNLIYDNDYGILVEVLNENSASPTIKNNVIYEVTSLAMSYGIFSRSNNYSSVNPKIYHNTIDGGTLDGIAMEKDGVSSSAPMLKYNIVTSFGRYGINNSGANPTIEYNDVWNNTAGNYSGIEVISNTNINEDPLYGSYSLLSNSPCINKIPSGEGDPVTLDYPGFKRPRPGKTTKDMGAYEYVAKETDNYTLPGGTGVATDYRIFTVALNLGTGADMLTAMENVLGSYDPTHWRAFLYTGTLYREFNSSQFASQVIVPGMGFWIITTYTNQIPFEGGPAPDGVDYVMDLEPGWHLIGLPWVNTQISLGNIKVTDGVNTYAITNDNNNLTQQSLWDFVGEGGSINGYEKRNDPTFLLQYNTGYFFKVVSPTPVRLIIPTSDAQGQSAPNMMAPSLNETTPHEDDELPPPPPGSDPIPDIRVNGQDGPVSVSTEDSVSVSIALDPGAWGGRNADWWVAARTPFDPPRDWCTYIYTGGWRPGIYPCLQTQLFQITPSFEVLNMTLPAGSYIFYFAVDGNMDGATDATWLDFVEVNVE